MDTAIRLRQCFANYSNALRQLRGAVYLCHQRHLSDLERLGLIKIFAVVHGLACSVFEDFFECQGDTSIIGARDATRGAIKRNLVIDGEGWMDMIASRSKLLHTYNESAAEEISENIIHRYFKLFEALECRLIGLHDFN